MIISVHPADIEYSSGGSLRKKGCHLSLHPGFSFQFQCTNHSCSFSKINELIHLRFVILYSSAFDEA